MFTLRKPDAEHLSHFLARQRTAPLTYKEVGATFADDSPRVPPRPRRHRPRDRRNGVDRARAGIREWAAHAGAGISIAPPAAPITEGTTVAVITSVGPLQVLAACRIVRVVDEPGRFGFAYGTLPRAPGGG